MMGGIYNKNYDFNVYGLSCGYIQKEESNHLSCELYLDGVYHVRFFDRNNGFDKDFNMPFTGRLWLTFESLTKARKAYAMFKRAVLKGSYQIVNIGHCENYVYPENCGRDFAVMIDKWNPVYCPHCENKRVETIETESR